MCICLDTWLHSCIAYDYKCIYLELCEISNSHICANIFDSAVPVADELIDSSIDPLRTIIHINCNKRLQYKWKIIIFALPILKKLFYKEHHNFTMVTQYILGFLN